MRLNYDCAPPGNSSRKVDTSAQFALCVLLFDTPLSSKQKNKNEKA